MLDYDVNVTTKKLSDDFKSSKVFKDFSLELKILSKNWKFSKSEIPQIKFR